MAELSTDRKSMPIIEFILRQCVLWHTIGDGIDRIFGFWPLLQQIINAQLQLVLVIPSQSSSYRCWQFQAVGYAISGSVLHASLRISRDNIQRWISTELMSQTIHSAQGNLVFLRQLSRILQSKIQFVIPYLCRIKLWNGINRLVIVAVHDRTVQLPP